MTKYLNRIWAVVLLAFVSCALWGSAFPMIKIGYAQFGITNSGPGAKILFAGVRFILAGILAWLAGSAVSRRPMLPRRSDWRKIIALCMFQTVLQYFFFYLGLANCTGVKSSIINGSGAFVVILLSTLVFRMEKMTARKLVGCILGFAGIIVINLGGVILSALGLAMGGASEPGWDITGAGVGTLLWLAFVSAAAYSLWAILLKHNPVNRVAVFGFLNPVCGVLLSALLLDEAGQAFSMRSLAALILVCLGIFIVNYEKKKPATVPEK